MIHKIVQQKNYRVGFTMSECVGFFVLFGFCVRFSNNNKRYDYIQRNIEKVIAFVSSFEKTKYKLFSPSKIGDGLRKSDIVASFIYTGIVGPIE